MAKRIKTKKVKKDKKISLFYLIAMGIISFLIGFIVDIYFFEI